LRLPTEEEPGTDPHDRAGAEGSVTSHTDDIEVAAPGPLHPLLPAMASRPPSTSRRFAARSNSSSREACRMRFDVLAERFGIAFQDAHDLVDHGPVVFFGLEPDAGAAHRPMW
jgi:hypothetical protein